MTTEIQFNRVVRESAQLYAEGLIEACAPKGIDPVKVLTDTDDYPQIVKKVEQVEYIVGWFNGVAEAHGILVETLWDQLVDVAPTKPARVVRAKDAAPDPRRRASATAPAPRQPSTRRPRVIDAESTEHRPLALPGPSTTVQKQARAQLDALRKRRKAA